MRATHSQTKADVAFQNAFARVMGRRYRAGVRHTPVAWAYAVASRYVALLSKAGQS